MRFFADFKIALANLRATRMRTLLTILGIVIGVASVTVVFALGEGAKNMVRNQVQQLGQDLLTIRPGKAQRDANGKVTSYNFLAALSASTLTERDLRTTAETDGVATAAPLMLLTGSISNLENKTSQGTIAATNGQADDVFGLDMRAGEFITADTPRNTVVLGDTLAIELLGSDVAIGHKITLRGQDFTVIGILKHFESSASVSSVFDLNYVAFIQMDDGKAFNQGIAQIQQINVRSVPGADPATIAKLIHNHLLTNHSGEEDFSVLRPEETVQLTDSVFKVLTNFTSAVASISIIVGGVGIMNIMLVSVTERTREIGIRKAVGATNAQILSQFLIEALLMSTVGGIVGVLTGYALAYIAGTFLGFMPGVTSEILIIALGISVGVGLLFGAWPAIKAARKDPIEALRYFQ
ncbi:MAG TPA: ABC transporter permease [Magnetospirillaceae bacterium]|nr:ABC transporter permease [Magnetospirillaceae bacterium]